MPGPPRKLGSGLGWPAVPGGRQRHRGGHRPADKEGHRGAEKQPGGARSLVRPPRGCLHVAVPPGRTHGPQQFSRATVTHRLPRCPPKPMLQGGSPVRGAPRGPQTLSFGHIMANRLPCPRRKTSVTPLRLFSPRLSLPRQGPRPCPGLELSPGSLPPSLDPRPSHLASLQSLNPRPGRFPQEPGPCAPSGSSPGVGRCLGLRSRLFRKPAGKAQSLKRSPAPRHLALGQESPPVSQTRKASGFRVLGSSPHPQAANVPASEAIVTVAASPRLLPSVSGTSAPGHLSIWPKVLLDLGGLVAARPGEQPYL